MPTASAAAGERFGSDRNRLRATVGLRHSSTLARWKIPKRFHHSALRYRDVIAAALDGWSREFSIQLFQPFDTNYQARRFDLFPLRSPGREVLACSTLFKLKAEESLPTPPLLLGRRNSVSFHPEILRVRSRDRECQRASCAWLCCAFIAPCRRVEGCARFELVAVTHL